MNKKMLSFVVLTVMFFSASAQQTSTDAPKIRFGVFFNPLVSWTKIEGSQIESDGSRMGFNAGLAMDKFFAPHYAFSTGISIQNMGGTVNYKNRTTPFRAKDNVLPSLPVNTSVTYKLQYLHIPFSLKMRTSEIGYFTYYAELGINPMINIKANTDVPSVNIKNTNISDEINFGYLGYHATLGLEYKIAGGSSLYTGLTYLNGITNVTSDVTLHCVELRVGIFF